jgi:putrescine aminotransferase
MEQHEVTRRYADHVNPSLVELLGTLGFGRVFVRAKGTRLWDAEGREYLDFLAAFGAMNLGHNHPRLLDALARAAGRDLAQLVHTGPAPLAAELAEALAQRVPELPIALLSLSGGEAVESAMKLARAATGRPGILACHGGFHGLGLGALSIIGPERFRKPVEPLLPGCALVPYGDLQALEQALCGYRHAAFVVEPLQGEGGVVVPPAGYLQRARALCRQYGTLFVLDEVQTGLHRCGLPFLFQADDLVPDVLVLGKALGGGMLPVSAALTTRELHREAFSGPHFDLHGSTYAGYALGAALSLEVLRAHDELQLAERAARLGERLVQGLRDKLSGHPLVREVRGRGLLVGVELGPTGASWLDRLAPGLVSSVAERAFGQWVALELLELPEPVLVQPASQRWSVLRLEPPLLVEEAEIDRVVDSVAGVLGRYESLPPLMAALSKRLGKQWWNGGAFG